MQKKGKKTVRLGFFLQIVAFVIIVTFVLAFAIFYIRLQIDRNRLDAISSELKELKEINKSLLTKIDSVSEELVVFSSMIPDGIKVKKKDSKQIKLDRKHKKRHDEATLKLYQSMNNFVHTLNSRIGFLLNSIQSTGFDPYDFLREKKSKLEKAKLSNTNLISHTLNSKDSYRKRAKYYYFRSKVLDDVFEVSDLSKKEVAESLPKVRLVFETLESIFHSLPIHLPMLNKVTLTSKYGLRKDPFSKRNTMHRGIDMTGNVGANVVASGPGIVKFAGFKRTYGYTVDIDHGYGLSSRYAHMGKLFVEKGDSVKAKQLIGLQGKTGSRCKGSHLHYELHRNKETINPINYIYAQKDFQNKKIAYFSKK